MRPNKLTMVAFGPYAKTVDLPMDILGETGLYAITGETGAGKTTIFDAIKFALYGVGSGAERDDGRCLRSTWADPDTETVVKLVFTCGGKQYSIERKPPQTLHGNKTERPAKATLTLPDGTSISKLDEIRSRIENDIIGVSAEQFSQIVMIAQGEFRRLLNAKSDERTRILRRIFRTERYDTLQRLIAEAASKKKEEYADARKRVLFHLKAMQAEPGSPLQDELTAMTDAKAEALYIDSALALSNRLTEADTAAYDEARAALTGAEQARSAADKALSDAQDLMARHEQLARLQAALSEAEAALTAAAEEAAEAESSRPEIDALSAQLTVLTQLLPEYAALRELNARLQQADHAADENERGCLATQAQIDAEDNALVQLSAEAARLQDAPERRRSTDLALTAARQTGVSLHALTDRVHAREEAAARLKNAAAELSAADNALTAAQTRLAELKDTLTALGEPALTLLSLQAADKDAASRARQLTEDSRLHSDWLTLCRRHEDAVRDYTLTRQRADEAAAAARHLRGVYEANIAGALASGLVNDTPCPVCGSLHHPHPAPLTVEAPAKEAVQAAEEEAGQIAALAGEKAVACGDLRGKADSLWTTLSDRYPEVSGQDMGRIIAQQQAGTDAERRALAGQIADAIRQSDRAASLQDREIPAAEAALEAARTRHQDAAAAVGTLRETLSACEEEVTRAAADLLPAGWQTEDLRSAVDDNVRTCRQLSDAAAAAAADVQRLTAIAEERDARTAARARSAEALMGLRQALATNRERAVNLRDQIAAQTQRLPYADEAACQTQITHVTGHRQALTDRITETARRRDDLRTRTDTLSGQVQALSAQLPEGPLPELPALEAAAAQTHTAYEAAEQAERALFARKNGNLLQAEQLAAQAAQTQALEQEQRMMQEVANTASGNVKSQARITLETYVQTAYFDRIIRCANQRLRHMSRGQYDLVRRKMADAGLSGKTGLDLDVIDHYNGTTREVGSLSGGESFLASLSLALGMSDAIQAGAASAVQLDAMFVDEGFGSLSSNFLNMVMDELTDTANGGHRLIGIISHVDDVKTAIHRRIEVTKDPAGGSDAKIR